MRYQIELAMVAIGFVTRVKRAQAIVDEEEAQRATRLVAKSIEMLFRCGAYTEVMDATRESQGKPYSFAWGPGAGYQGKSSRNRGQVRCRFRRASSLAPGASIAGPVAAISGILSSMREGYDDEEEEVAAA